MQYEEVPFELIADQSFLSCLFQTSPLVLATAIGELTAEERVILALIYFEDLGTVVIADILGIDQSGVLQTHLRAVDRIRMRLNDLTATTDDSSGLARTQEQRLSQLSVRC